jgi:aryl-alcohol dehydrogenase-like predicted oxidoreductase
MLQVSPVALGTWAMGGSADVWGHVDDRESTATIHQAIDIGINLIDTAPIYGLGHAERILGKAIRGRRGEVIIATKCGLLFPSASHEPPRRCLNRDSILRECDESLRRLGVDVIDLYQCHWPDPETPIRETMGAMTYLLEQGAIRAIGLSNFSCEQLISAREFGPVHAIQPPFSLVNTRAADDLIPFCQAHDIAVLVYSPLAKGLLTGKFDAESTFEDLRARDPDFLGNRLHRNLHIADGLKVVAEQCGRTPAQVALNWTTHHPGVTSAITGARRPSQVMENAGGVGWRLTNEQVAQVGHLAGGSH